MKLKSIRKKTSKLNVLNLPKMSALLIFSFLISTEAFARKKQKVFEFQGVVQSCHDGDTCRVSVNKEVLKVRFFGIDAPELNQEYGKEAQKYTANLILNKNVNLKCFGNSYDRSTCEIDLDGKIINQQLVKAGWAVDSPKYSKGKYKPDESYARENKLGMWRLGFKLSPHCYRHKKDKRCKLNAAFMPN